MILKTEAIFDYFENTGVKFGILTETWTTDVKERKIKDTFENEKGLGILMKSRKKKGGGVALVYKKSEIQFVNRPFFSGEYEILVSSTKIPGTNVKLFVFSVYYPPSMTVQDVDKMNELICDEIIKIKSEHKNPLIIVAGDMNKKNCDCIAEFTDIRCVQSAPTRYKSVLDMCYTNIYIESNNVSIPLWSTSGSESDHRVVLYNAAYIGQKFSYVKIKRRKFTKSSEDHFCDLVENHDWTAINNFFTASERVDYFHRTIECYKDKCFPYKISRIRNDEDPWITDHIRKLIKKRNITFQIDGRGEDWKVMRDLVR